MTSGLFSKKALKVSVQTKKAVKTTARYSIANSKPLRPCVHIRVRNYPSLREQDHCVTIRTQMQWQPYSLEQEYHHSSLLMHPLFHINNIMLEQHQDPANTFCRHPPTWDSGIPYSNTQAKYFSGTMKHA